MTEWEGKWGIKRDTKNGVSFFQYINGTRPNIRTFIQKRIVSADAYEYSLCELVSDKTRPDIKREITLQIPSSQFTFPLPQDPFDIERLLYTGYYSTVTYEGEAGGKQQIAFQKREGLDTITNFLALPNNTISSVAAEYNPDDDRINLSLVSKGQGFRTIFDLDTYDYGSLFNFQTWTNSGCEEPEKELDLRLGEKEEIYDGFSCVLQRDKNVFSAYISESTEAGVFENTISFPVKPNFDYIRNAIVQKDPEIWTSIRQAVPMTVQRQRRTEG